MSSIGHLIFRDRVSLNLELTDLARLRGQLVLEILITASPLRIGVQVCAAIPCLSCGCWELNSYSHACMADNLH